MINHFRRLVQDKLSSIPDLEAGEIASDEMIEDTKIYFGYRITKARQQFNLDYSNANEIYTLTGYLSTRQTSLQSIDDITDAIVDKLSELRIKCTTTDITTLDSKVRKVMITGTTKYDTLDGLLK